MDDKFLYRLRKQPDAEFVNGLHGKLSQIQSEGDNKISSLFRSNRMVKVIAALVIVFLVILTSSPVRGFVSSLIKQVAGLSFEVTGDYPGDNYPGGEEIIEPRLMPLAEALAAYPHSIRLPGDVPSGYVLNEDEVRVFTGEDAGPFANTIEFQWVSDDQGSFMLRITDQDASISEVVAPDTIEEILLTEDHPAVLIRGGWDANQKAWNNEVGVRLRWSVDDLTYDLMGADQEQLIVIAESMLK